MDLWYLWCLVIQYAFPGCEKVDVVASTANWLFSLIDILSNLSVSRKTNKRRKVDQVQQQKKWVFRLLQDAMFQEWKSIILTEPLHISMSQWQILIHCKADVCAQDDLALFRASHGGYLAQVCCLVENKANVNARNDGPIFAASLRGHLDVVHYLIKKKANVDTKDVSICWASRNGHLEVVRCLIENKANVNARNDLPICWASKKGHLETVRCLIENKANVNALTLRADSENHHPMIVKLLQKKRFRLIRNPF